MTAQTRDHGKEALSLLRTPELWPGTGPRDLLGSLYFCSLLLGQKYSDEFLEEIRIFYRHVRERTTSKERLEVLGRLSGLVEGREAGIASLIPFLFVDEEPAVISSAALALSVLITPRNGDPLTGPRNILRYCGWANTETSHAGILQGVLLLGDRRVLPLLDRCWEPLGPQGRRLLVHSWSGFVYASTIDFLLGWLERTEDETDFGAIAGVLASYPIRPDAYPFVVDVERKFPANGPGKGLPVRRLGRWTFEEYGTVIAPRLEAIGEVETGEKVIPKILTAWGIGRRDALLLNRAFSCGRKEAT